MDFTCILKKIRGEQLSPQEQEQFERWYGESETHRDFFTKYNATSWPRLSNRMSIRHGWRWNRN